MLKAFKRFEGWLYRPGSATRLAGMRIGLSSLLGLRIFWSRAAEVAGQPAILYRPLSFMHVFSQMPSSSTVRMLQVIGIAGAVLACVGIAAKVTFPIAWLSALILAGMWTSGGKITHNDVTLLLVAAPLLVAPLADRWALWPKRTDRHSPSALYGWPVRVGMLIVAVVYFSTGLHKVVGSGPAWVTSDNLRWALLAGQAGSGPDTATSFLLSLPHVWIKLLAGCTLALELAFPIVLWRPKTAWLFIPSAIALHVAIAATLGLDYTAWIAVDLIVFIPWDTVSAWASRSVSQPT